MNGGEVLAVLLVLVPVVGSMIVLAARRRAATVWTVLIVSAAMVLSSVGLLLFMAADSFRIIAIDAHDLFPMGPAMIVLDLVLAAVFVIIGWRIRSWWVVGIAAANLVLAVALDSWLNFTEATPALLVDNLALIMALITSIIGSIIAIYALRYMRDDPRQPRFFAVILLFLGGMNGAVFSNDMLWLFLFWDVTTLCSFLLIGHTGTVEAKRAAERALRITIAGALAFIVGAILAYNYYGTTSLVGIPVGGLDGLAVMPLALLAVAGFTKSAQFPFQSWLLGAMVAPTPVSALLHSATMVNLGVYLLIRTSPSLVEVASLSWVIALVGGATFLASTVLAMTQSNSKRVLAWSTIGNLGLITMCVGISTPLAITAAVVLLLYHSISKALLFLSVGVVKERLGSEDIEDMQGIRTTMPYASAALIIGVFTLVLPPFGMFVSKWLIVAAAGTYQLLLFLLVLGFAGMMVYYFKWIGTILSAGPGARSIPVREDSLARNYKWTLGALMAGAVVLSALIGPVLRYLIAPFIERYFVIPVGTDNLSLFTSSGEFPVFLFLLLTAIIFLGLMFLVRPGEDEVSKIYAGGEEFELETRNNYYWDGAKVLRAVAVSEGAGVLMVVAILVLPFLLEVV
ncbi:MAG: NADH-quinone oxidoreductase subunit L [Methanomassiliicoccus sp.]|nr:NADH-quinone oxidoreductase subunit L [Methanomassiliicoccus sp.]